MRLIDRAKLVSCKTKSWDENSAVWADQVSSAKDPSEKVSSIGNKWSSLKGNFINTFGDKCWYTESPRIGTDFDVDHYWPKGRVKDADGSIVKIGENQHPGYWWKAFDIKNYRYSCIYANRSRGGGGKVDYFPLSDETKRAWTETSPCDYDYHQILDPCCLDDVQLLSFEVETGKTASRLTEDVDPAGFEKVKISKILLNLDHETIAPQRLSKIKDTQRAIRLLKIASSIDDVDLDDEDREGIEEAKKQLKELCNRKSPFSAAVIQHILPNKKLPYLVDIIDELDLAP